MKTSYHYIPKKQKVQKYWYPYQGTGTPSGKHHYSYTYNYDWLKKEENILDSCKISVFQELKLTENQLELVQEKKTNTFPLSHLKNISVSYRYIMLPIIIGGILAPFSLVAIFGNHAQGWSGIVGLFAGVMLLYYGFNGSYQLVIEMTHNTFTTFIGEQKNEVEGFVQRMKSKRR
ncbi:hypothetical protein R9C00_22520 [Flammeovirgaceae bacterium SG7u.111]|nr:hypothetical protein [Flammeovirgaceae bacterium SG7u.132]WPO34479.1 hypothetical protein R9C00_22520 [Flammeovirgaceae bacterium SG7u.111]